MTGDDELLQVEQVIERLITRYPAVSPVDIEHIVRNIHKRFAAGRIRDFVPLLVEKAARHDIGNRVSEVAAIAPVVQDLGKYAESQQLLTMQSAGKPSSAVERPPESRHSNDL